MGLLDKNDRKILFELDNNSRQSLNKISKKLRLNRDVVAYRIKRLEQAGIIKKYVSVIDYTRIGYQLVRLYIKLQNTTPSLEAEIACFFQKEKNVLTLYQVDGPYDIAVGILVRDMKEYHEVYSSFLKKYRKNIVKSQFSIIIDLIHYPRSHLVGKKNSDNSFISTGSFVKSNLDEKEISLLREISKNSRITLLELAKKLNLTPNGAKYKLRSLEKKKILVAYKILIDHRKIGREYFKVDIDIEDHSILKSLKQFVTEHPNITYQDVVVGGKDFEIDGEFEDQEDFYRFMNEVKELFPGKIRSYSYYRARKIYNYSYCPF